MRYAITLLAMTSLLAAMGCGDKDWDEEIVLQIFKLKKMNVGTVTVTAMQDGRKVAQSVNGDNMFFNSCETNRVRIIPADKGGAYPDVTVTVTSANFAKATSTTTIKVPTTGMVQIVLGSGTNYDPSDCKPKTTTQLKETGEACTSNSQCKGGRCLFALTDGGKKFPFQAGYCTATCLTNAKACDASSCAGAPAAGEKDCCYSVADGYGKKIDAVCLKRCAILKDCRYNEGYQCTPGYNCFPTTK